MNSFLSSLIQYEKALKTAGRDIVEARFRIEKVIYNNPATIVYFADGKKVVVKCRNEKFDREKAVAMAIMRRIYSRRQFCKIVDSGATQNRKKVTAKPKAENLLAVLDQR